MKIGCDVRAISMLRPVWIGLKKSRKSMLAACMKEYDKHFAGTAGRNSSLASGDRYF